LLDVTIIWAQPLINKESKAAVRLPKCNEVSIGHIDRLTDRQRELVVNEFLSCC
jgi:hypothetical protein